MPPRPPLSSSSSFQSTLSPVDDDRHQNKVVRHSYNSGRQSLDQGTFTPLLDRLAKPRNPIDRSPRESFASAYDEVQSLSSNKEEEEVADTAIVYPAAYGGAGYYSEPQRGRIRFSAQNAMNKEEKKTMEQTPTIESGNVRYSRLDT